MNLNNRKTKLIVAGVALIIVLGFGLFKLAGGVWVFAYWKPTYLPNGTSIRATRLLATKESVITEMNFRTVDWVYGINERSVSNASLPSASGNYKPDSSSFTCSMFISLKNEKYRLCHSVDYGSISVFEVTQIKDHTLITTRFPEPVGHTISTADISKYVDSFRHVLHSFPITFRHDGP